MITDQMVETASLAVCRAEGLPSVMWPTVADSVRVALEAVVPGRLILARAWDDGYNDAYNMARSYGHTDHWEESEEPDNPYRSQP